ncbi:MAG: formyltetrahydrofolate deformylase [Proteobacteria bacterium]|nr:formyltetrahydrofolate deformylase [Pseudomonadota bacterium]
MDSIVFLIQCPDQKGLVSQISTFFFERGFNILECQEHVDMLQNQYFMRIKLDMSGLTTSRKELEKEFTEFGTPLHLNWSVYYSNQLSRVAVLVTAAPHCLYDILVRHEQNELQCDIPIIISNRPQLESIADKFRIPFHCLPIKNKDDKARQENEIRELLQQHHIDLIVLARYMQILTESFTKDNFGKIINIHHAFLPAFKGANPYRNAYERGVKMIGATAHYATAELDAGPIIEQDVQRVTHKNIPEDLARIGADIERIVLARAVKAHLERRIIIAGNRTVVFT